MEISSPGSNNTEFGIGIFQIESTTRYPMWHFFPRVFIEIALIMLLPVLVRVADAREWGQTCERFPGLFQWEMNVMNILQEYESNHPNTVLFCNTNTDFNGIPYIRVIDGKLEYPCEIWTENDWNWDFPWKGVWTNSIPIFGECEQISIVDLLRRINLSLNEQHEVSTEIYFPAWRLTKFVEIVTIRPVDQKSFPVDVLVNAICDGNHAQNGYSGNILRLDYWYGVDSEWYYNQVK